VDGLKFKFKKFFQNNFLQENSAESAAEHVDLPINILELLLAFLLCNKGQNRVRLHK